METSWARVSPVIGLIVIVLILSGLGFFSWKGGQDFEKECKAVSGRVLVDNDGDLECYRNGIEIAEYGESSP